MPDVPSAPAPAFEITVDGRPVLARPGQTLAAAMLADGRRDWRTTRFAAQRRGLFCGIGVCFDCLVTVHGVRSVRACLAVAEPGDVLTTERGSGYADHAI